MESIYPEVIAGNGVEVRLPESLCATLYDHFGARYNPAKGKRTFDYNLDASSDQVLTYLGTYFPRSLAESFVIFDSLLSDKRFAEDVVADGCVSICSVGTGTGGDLIGLILALDKRLSGSTRMEVVSIEGNAEAHEMMYRVLSTICPHLQSRVFLSRVSHVFRPPQPFSNLGGYLSSEAWSFDFIVTAKMLNELDKAGVSDRPYYDFCDFFSRRLKPNGVMLILDVTSQSGDSGQWIPKMLNGQINEFVVNNDGFKTVLPLLCNRFEETCGCDCYTQNIIAVTHRYAKRECSKICYRVIGRSGLADRLCFAPALWDCPIVKDNVRYCDEFLR